jgi:2-hydroxy-3-oxopropionate reductase
MGGRMAARLLGAGFEVAVHDAAAEALDALPGAVICRDPRDVSDRAEIVLISLPSPAAVRDVAAGPRGLIGGSSMRAYVDLSTTGPEVAAEVGAWMDVAGVECVDAPVSGGPGGAQSGQLTIMLSGSPAALESARPVLEHLGSKFFNVGERAGTRRRPRSSTTSCSPAPSLRPRRRSRSASARGWIPRSCST